MDDQTPTVVVNTNYPSLLSDNKNFSGTREKLLTLGVVRLRVEIVKLSHDWYYTDFLSPLLTRCVSHFGWHRVGMVLKRCIIRPIL